MCRRYALQLHDRAYRVVIINLLGSSLIENDALPSGSHHNNFLQNTLSISILGVYEEPAMKQSDKTKPSKTPAPSKSMAQYVCSAREHLCVAPAAFPFVMLPAVLVRLGKRI